MNQKTLVNIAYYPQKRMLDEFLEYLVLNIDKATTEKKRINLMGDYNLSYLCKNEKQNLDTILRPCGLNSIIVEDTTKITRHNKMPKDFLTTDKYLKTLLVAVFKSMISSDHSAQLSFLKTVFGTKKRALIKNISDKRNCNKSEIQKRIECSNWRKFCI